MSSRRPLLVTLGVLIACVLIAGLAGRFTSSEDPWMPQSLGGSSLPLEEDGAVWHRAGAEELRATREVSPELGAGEAPAWTERQRSLREWLPTVEEALGDPVKAAQLSTYADAAGLELDPETELSLARVGVSTAFTQLSDESLEDISAMEVSRLRLQDPIGRLLELGRHEGYSMEALEGIQESFLPAFQSSAEAFAAELRNAVVDEWDSGRVVAWRIEGEPDPGVPDREGREGLPVLETTCQMGKYGFRMSLHAEDHSRLLAVSEEMKGVRQMILDEQLRYLMAFEK